jgi:hypothetical protein
MIYMPPWYILVIICVTLVSMVTLLALSPKVYHYKKSLDKIKRELEVVRNELDVSEIKNSRLADELHTVIESTTDNVAQTKFEYLMSHITDSSLPINWHHQLELLKSVKLSVPITQLTCTDKFALSIVDAIRETINECYYIIHESLNTLEVDKVRVLIDKYREYTKSPNIKITPDPFTVINIDMDSYHFHSIISSATYTNISKRFVTLLFGYNEAGINLKLPPEFIVSCSLIVYYRVLSRLEAEYNHK